LNYIQNETIDSSITTTKCGSRPTTYKVSAVDPQREKSSAV